MSVLGWAKTIMPWIGTTALVAWLISAHDMSAVADALLRANLGGLAALWIVAIGLTYATDSIGLWMAFVRLNGASQFLEVLRIKGISYFLNIVNYAAASGGIAWLVSKRSEFPLRETVSTVLFLNVVDLLVLNVFVSFGLVLELSGGAGGSVLTPEAQSTLIVVNLVIYGLYFGSMVYWNLGWDFFVLGRLRGLTVFAAFRRADVSVHLSLFGVRVFLLSLYIAMQYLVLNMFEIAAPLGAVMVINTVVTLVQTVPISVAGFGTVQIAMLELYAPYGSDAAILGYSTASLLVFVLVRAGIGYGCLLLDRSKGSNALEQRD
jgi:hypothetical protein